MSSFDKIEIPKNISEIFKEMITNSGESVYDLSFKQTVLLIFIRHMGCIICRDLTINLDEIHKQLKALGITLVISHQENHEEGDLFFQIYAPSLIECPRIQDNNLDFYKKTVNKFSVPLTPSVFLRALKLLSEGLTNDRSNLDRYSEVTSQVMFIIQKGELKKYFVNKFTESPDILKTILDPEENEGLFSVNGVYESFDSENVETIHSPISSSETNSMVDMSSSFDEKVEGSDLIENNSISEISPQKSTVSSVLSVKPLVNIPKNREREFKKISLVKKRRINKKKKQINKKKSFSCYKAVEEDSEGYYEEMLKVLSNKKERDLFKLHAAKEFSVENFIFIEAVEKFKSLITPKKSIIPSSPRNQRKFTKDEKQKIVMYCEFIIETFLGTSSIYAININDIMFQKITSEVNSAKQKLSTQEDLEFEINENLFDFIIQDLQKDVLLDCFIKFKKSIYYTKMIQRRNSKFFKKDIDFDSDNDSDNKITTIEN